MKRIDHAKKGMESHLLCLLFNVCHLLIFSDTIVVMNQGYIQQIGTPEDIYNEPQNAFVALKGSTVIPTFSPTGCISVE